MTWNSVRWACAVIAFAMLIGGNVLQQAYYVDGRLDEFDRTFHGPNLALGWILLVLAVILSLRRERAGDAP